MPSFYNAFQTRQQSLCWSLWVLVVTWSVCAVSSQRASPVIGILTQPTSYDDGYVIAASYVKWLESGGARSIPIPYDADRDLVYDIFQQINGVFFPGGASDVPPAAQYLIELAANDTDTFFPVWGTCLGFEYILQVLSNSSSSTNPILVDGFDAENISLALDNVVQKELYEEPRIYDIVTNYNVTMNNHHRGVEPQTFLGNAKLNELFQITSTNVDRNGRRFVSTIEPRYPNTFPFYGVQYHPEKNPFEYGTYKDTNIPYEAINHSDQAVEFSAYLARFFVRLTTKQQAMKTGTHSYNKVKKYPRVDFYPMKHGTAFELYYKIPSAKHWSTTNVMES